MFFVYFVLLQYTGVGGRLASEVFFSGPRAFQFWLFQVAVGLALPFALTLRKKTRENAVVSSIAAGAAMWGTLYGCLNIFIGGQLLPMIHFRWESLAPEPGKITFGLIAMAAMLVLSLVSYKLLPYENVEA